MKKVFKSFDKYFIFYRVWAILLSAPVLASSMTVPIKKVKFELQLMDDYDLKDLNVRHLREVVVSVGQEPVLFDGSIASNITYGLPPNAHSRDDIIEAAKMANIFDFVRTLPQVCIRTCI